MLEDDYTKCLNKLLETCECDLAVPSEWQDQLARQGVIESIPGDRRKYIRHHFNDRAVLEYAETFTSIPRVHTIANVVTRDISLGGIAFLHSEQLFPGEQVSLWLSIGKRFYVVERCLQHDDHCFEIGAAVAECLPRESMCR
jgi:PilZ domain-containing protein